MFELVGEFDELIDQLYEVLKAFELSQALAEKWVSADALTKRHLLQIVCLNSTLEGESLVFTVRKPFDLLANGTILKDGRGAGIRTRDLLVPNQAR